MLSGLDAVGARAWRSGPIPSATRSASLSHCSQPPTSRERSYACHTREISRAVAQAIGVVPVDPLDIAAAVAAGEVQGAESAFAWAETLPMFGTFTAEHHLLPEGQRHRRQRRDLRLAVSDDQQDVLRQAATDTLAYAVETNRLRATYAAAVLRRLAAASALADEARGLAELTAKRRTGDRRTRTGRRHKAGSSTLSGDMKEADTATRADTDRLRAEVHEADPGGSRSPS